MNSAYWKEMIQTAKKAEDLMDQIKGIQRCLEKITRHELKANISIKELCPAPSERSNDMIWMSVSIPYWDYEKFETICTEELKNQLTAQLDVTLRELDDLHVKLRELEATHA